MPILTPNLSEIETREPLEDGAYPGTVAQVDLGTSTKGNPQLIVDVKVVHNGKNYSLRTWVQTQGKAAFQFEQFLRACGLGAMADAYKKGDTSPFDTDSVVGANVLINVKQEMYNDEVRNKIASFAKA